jgi:hypothetical protein
MIRMRDVTARMTVESLRKGECRLTKVPKADWGKFIRAAGKLL